ncbi:MAG TPA: protein-L-isoaspartate O-methyltransferase [Rhizomicrobium sp.]|jgi:protein-L-isoaspartate(D-aspartate) O-methyltransferase|nr:protein-L-isoaspartate O-methyltransferase [Rhizomicrobium sp.]
MSSFAAQRLNMVESQLRASDIGDPRILSAMSDIPRETFVPAPKRSLAYAELALEVAPGRYLLEPRTLARLIALAEVGRGDRVLDVGPATGYSSAVLSRLSQSVVALEEDAGLAAFAKEALASAGDNRVRVVCGPHDRGVANEGPFDVIFLNGAVPEPPKVLLGQLAEGGRLVAPVCRGADGKAWRFQREEGHFGGVIGFDAPAPQLVGFQNTVGFVF